MSGDVSYPALMAKSFERWTGVPLLDYAGVSVPEGTPIDQALQDAPFALVSHGTEADPVFRYANKTALRLWETDAETFCRMPSRQSAENVTALQADRQALLAEALKKGWVDNYSGVRISKSGKRFEIKDTVLWNVVDDDGKLHGQAALILDWRHLAQNHARGGIYPQPTKGRGIV